MLGARLQLVVASSWVPLRPPRGTPGDAPELMLCVRVALRAHDEYANTTCAGFYAKRRGLHIASRGAVHLALAA